MPLGQVFEKPVIVYYGCRNYLITVIKNIGFKWMVKFLTFQLLSFLLLFLMYLLRGKLKHAFAIVKAIFYVIFHLGEILKKRHFVQTQIRKVSDKEIFDKVMVKVSLKSMFLKSLKYTSDENNPN